MYWNNLWLEPIHKFLRISLPRKIVLGFVRMSSEAFTCFRSWIRIVCNKRKHYSFQISFLAKVVVLVNQINMCQLVLLIAVNSMNVLYYRIASFHANLHPSTCPIQHEWSEYNAQENEARKSSELQSRKLFILSFDS